MTIAQLLNTLKYRQLPPNSLITRNAARLAEKLISSVGAWGHQDEFRPVDCFCLFVGHERSGHSLVGALLDAHPQMIIAHELDAVRYMSVIQRLAIGVSEQELYYLLLERSKWFARRNGEWTGYKYAVPSQYKGKFTSLKVIGDKKGGGTALALRRNPGLMDMLRQLLSVPIKVVHVSRHPLDNIATMARKCHGDVDSATDAYFRRCGGVLNARNRTSDENWLSLSLEAFIEDTEECLAQACEFLEVEREGSYLRDCSEIVFDTPNRSRDKISFTLPQIKQIQRKAENFPFLNRYDLSEPLELSKGLQ